MALLERESLHMGALVLVDPKEAADVGGFISRTCVSLKVRVIQLSKVSLTQEMKFSLISSGVLLLHTF